MKLKLNLRDARPIKHTYIKDGKDSYTITEYFMIPDENGNEYEGKLVFTKQLSASSDWGDEGEEIVKVFAIEPLLTRVNYELIELTDNGFTLMIGDCKPHQKILNSEWIILNSEDIENKVKFKTTLDRYDGYHFELAESALRKVELGDKIIIKYKGNIISLKYVSNMYDEFMHQFPMYKIDGSYKGLNKTILIDEFDRLSLTDIFKGTKRDFIANYISHMFVDNTTEQINGRELYKDIEIKVISE